MNRRIGVGVLLASLGFVLVPDVPAPAQETVAAPCFAKLLPRECRVYVSVRDVATLRRHLDAVGLQELMDHQEIKDFLAYLQTRAEEQGLRTRLPKALQEITPEDLLNSVEGEICLAFGTLDSACPQQDNQYILVNAKSRADGFATLVQKFQQAYTDTGATKSEESYKGVTITTFTRCTDLISMCRNGTWFAFAPATDGLKRLITRSQESSGDDLTSNPLFQSVTGAVGENADLTFYANLEGEEGVKDIRALLGLKAKSADPFVECLAIESVKAAGFGVTITSDRISAKGYIHTPGGPEGLASALFPSGPNPEIPPFVPEDADAFTALRIDVAKIYDTVLNMATAAQKASGRVIDIEQAVQEKLGISLRDDVFDQIKSIMYLYAKYRRPFTADSVENFYVWTLKDGAKFQEAIQRILDVIAQQAGGTNGLETEEYLGSKIYSVQQFAMAVKSTYWIIGTKDSVMAVMRRLSGSEKTLADDALYQELAQELPAGYQSVGFSNPDPFEWLLTLIKSGDIFNLLAGYTAGMRCCAGPEEMKEQAMEEFDFSKIPSPALFVERIVGMISYITSSSEGITLASILKIKKTR